MNEAKNGLEKAKERVSRIISDCNEYYDLTIVDEHISKLEDREKKALKAMINAYVTIRGLESYYGVNHRVEEWLTPVIEEISGKSIHEALSDE